MAPAKGGAKNSGLISNFFKPFISQKPKGSQNQEVGEEIVVATRPASQQQPPPTTASQTKTTPVKRNPGRPKNSPPSSASQSSQSDGTQTPKRGRGRPKREPPTCSSSSRLQNGGKRGRGRPRKSESQQQRDDQLGASEASPSLVCDTESRHFNINPLTGKADVTPTKDSPFRPASDSPARRLVTGAAALSPSPPRQTADMSAPPLPKPQSGTPADKPPTASFSSVSTLTSVPKSSQASTFPVSSSTSSRRIMSDGLQGVTGSDSESEDLEDLETVYSNKRRKLSQNDDVKVGANAPKQSLAKKSIRLPGQEKSKNFFRAFPRSPAKPKLQNSLASLVADHEREQLAEATIASLESAVEQSKKQEQRQQALEHAGYDGEALIAAAGSDSDDRERMIMALARTEALHDKNEYHFFLDPEPLHADSTFPIDSLPDEPWTKIYRNAIPRKEACISGFAAELAAKFPLPMSVTSWMASQLQYEKIEERCEAYVEILRASGQHDQSISDTWGSLNSIYKTRSLFENNWKDHVKIALPRGLTHIIRLISFRAPAIDSIVSEAPPNSTCAAFLDLALMSVDELVKDDINLCFLIADCIVDMLEALTEESYQKLIPLVVGTMFSPSALPEVIRCRAIAALPATTPRAHKLRRRLALEYFNTTEKKATDPIDWPKSIIHTLKTSPHFHVSESTDYTLLASLTLLLDIAIDAGWTDYALLAPRESTGAWGERAPPTPAEIRHNKDVDALTDALKAMASRIRDAGTSHLRRTETKSLIEQVVARLQYCVRTRVRPTRGVFDGKGMKQARFDVDSFVKRNNEEKGEETKKDEEEVVSGQTVGGSERFPVDDEEEAEGLAGVVLLSFVIFSKVTYIYVKGNGRSVDATAA